MNDKEPLTRTDLDQLRDTIKREIGEGIHEMRTFVLDRGNALIWKVIALQVTLIAAIAGAQWAAITWMMMHWKP